MKQSPKEKAIELVDEFYDKIFDLRDGYNSTEIYQAVKQCALIAVDEILNTTLVSPPKKYWQEVKQEIETL